MVEGLLRCEGGLEIHVAWGKVAYILEMWAKISVLTLNMEYLQILGE